VEGAAARTDGRPSVPGRFERADLVVVVALAAVTAVFLLAWPRKLGNADESYLLFEAKRLSDGEVMYRDVFDFITPLATYLMAAAYRLFGATIETVRVVMAVVHASAVALVYAGARLLGVRRVLAVGPALGLVVFGYPTFPEASPHWFATALMALLVVGLVGWRWDVRCGPAFALGLVDGALLSMQQQKGAVLGIGLAVIVVVVTLLASRDPARERGASLVRRLLALAAGAVVVTGAVLGGTAVVAGVAPLVDAVVRYPLESYAPAGTVGWGGIAPFMQRRATPATLAYARLLPVALVVPAARALIAAWPAPASAFVRSRLALVLFGGSSALAIAYFPDFIHVAFVAPAFLVAAADTLEWVVAWMPGERARTALAAAIACVVVAGLGWRAVEGVRVARGEFPIAHDTAFGRVDLAVPWQAAIVDRLRRELDAAPSRDVFAYPQMASPYLLAGGTNPTRFQMFNGVVAPKGQIDELLAALTRHRVRWVVANPHLLNRPRDPVMQYLRDHYEPIEIPEIDTYADLVMWWLYRRRGDADAPPAS